MEAGADQILQDCLITIREETIDAIFSELKDQLWKTTKSYSNETSNLKGYYVTDDSDLRALIDHFLHAIHRLQETPTSRARYVKTSGLPKPRPFTPATSANPATTISVPEACFPPLVGNAAQSVQRKHSTTATIVSEDGTTDVTWLMSQNPQPKGDSNLLGSFMGGIACQNTSESPVADRYANTANNNGHPSGKQRTSMVVFTGEDNDYAVAALDPVFQAPERKPSVLSRLRKKRVRFGQSDGPPVDGGYHNRDYKPRRESSLIRMRAILDRLEPARPKQDTVVFAAMTGAQPIRPAYDLVAHKPTYLNQPCSEDGRQHLCTQQGSIPPSPG